MTLAVCAALCVVGAYLLSRPKRRRGYLVAFRPSRGWYATEGA